MKRPYGQDLVLRFNVLDANAAPVTPAYNDAEWGTLSLVVKGDAATDVEKTITLTNTGDYAFEHVAAGLCGVLIPAEDFSAEGEWGIVGTYDGIKIDTEWQDVEDLDAYIELKAQLEADELGAIKTKTDQLAFTSARVNAHVGAIASNAIAADAIAADALAAIGGAVQDRQIVVRGTIAAAAGTSITLDANASGSNDAYNGGAGQHVLVIIGNTGATQHAYITDYVGSSKVATVDRTLDPLPDSSSAYLILKLA